MLFGKAGAVLVTGGAGYVGSHICKALGACGIEVVVYDNLWIGHEDFVKWGTLERGSLHDTEKLSEVFKKHNIRAVMHFAAFSYVGESVKDPSSYYGNNVVGTLALLDTMVEHGVSHLVFSSTSATYGMPLTTPINETHPQRPINPYGKTKLVIESMIDDFDVAYGIKGVKLRYFNAAGADPECEIGEDHDPETHLIPLALDAAAGRGPGLTIFGDDYDTEDGTCIRDYIHVTDLADAHVKALEYVIESNETTAFNLGNGNGFSVKEVIKAVEKVTGRPVNAAIGPRRDGDPSALVASSDKARRLLLWEPAYPGIEDIVRDAWQWYQKRFPSSD